LGFRADRSVAHLLPRRVATRVGIGKASGNRARLEVSYNCFLDPANVNDPCAAAEN
jgi:hypothetical protein